MNVKVKKETLGAKLPERNKDGVCFNLFARSSAWSPSDLTGKYTEYRTGVSFKIPKGYVGVVIPHDEIYRTHHFLRNSLTVIDHTNNKEVSLKFAPDPSRMAYKVGDVIAKIFFVKATPVELEEIK